MSDHEEEKRPSGVAGWLLKLLSSPQKLAHWLLFFMILFIVKDYVFGRHTQATATAQPGDLTGQLVRKNDALPLFPVFTNRPQAQTLHEGKGMVARCGQTITYSYKLTDSTSNNVQEEATESAPKTMVLGQTSTLLSHYVQALLIGQPIGTALRASLTAKDLNPEASATSAFTLETKLLGATPAFPESQAPLRVFEIAAGSGQQLECGEYVTVALSGQTADGQPLDQLPNTLSFRYGANEVPLGLEAALEHMARGGKRTAIIPPAYRVPLKKNAQRMILSLPEATTSIIDIHLIERQKNAPTSSHEQAPANPSAAE